MCGITGWVATGRGRGRRAACTVHGVEDSGPRGVGRNVRAGYGRHRRPLRHRVEQRRADRSGDPPEGGPGERRTAGRRESDDEWAMRKICYLHLTRIVRILLDRKDRMSMAVGLEVRVPFCDHRLVEYVFNIPWHLKTFDGREKSILRAATRELLPDSIVKREKNPYPSTQEPAYEKAVRAEVAEILADRSHPAAPLLNRKVLEDMLARPLGNTSSLP